MTAWRSSLNQYHPSVVPVSRSRGVLLALYSLIVFVNHLAPINLVKTFRMAWNFCELHLLGFWVSRSSRT
jgi:hypothetical protein